MPPVPFASAAAALLPMIATAAAAAATAAIAPTATVAVDALSPRSLYQHLLHEIQVRAEGRSVRAEHPMFAFIHASVNSFFLSFGVSFTLLYLSVLFSSPSVVGAMMAAFGAP